MDPLQYSAVARAHNALGVALGEEREIDRRDLAKSFVAAARAIAAAGMGREREALAESSDYFVSKAVAANTGQPVWQTDDARALAAAYVASIGEFSILDRIALYAKVLPIRQRRVMLASGFTANVIEEASPKVVRSLALSIDPETAQKIAAIIVSTKELVLATDGESQALFAAELERAILRGMNAAAISALVDSGTTTIGASGDPLTDLRAALRAAGPSNGYVVAAPAGDVADLATRVESTAGMSVRGGTFRPGIEVVAMDDIDAMTIVPASRLALYLTSLELRASGEGDVNMSDSPSAPSELVSLWQTNSVGIIAERSFHIAGDRSGVVLVAGS